MMIISRINSLMAD